MGLRNLLAMLLNPKHILHRTQPLHSLSPPTRAMAPPSWVILATAPRVSADLPPAADLSLALAAPPRVAHLTLGPRVFPADPDPQARLASPCLLAADPSSARFLVLAPPSVADRPPTRPRVYTGPSGVERTVHIGRVPEPNCFLLDVPAATASRVPDPDCVTFNWGDLGVIAAPAGGYMLAGFDFIVGSKDAELICFSSQTGEWVTKDVRNPLRSWIWNFRDVVSHDAKLWWVDTAAGLLSCDPFADHPVMAYVPLPKQDKPRRRCCYYCSERAAASRRRVMLSDAKFRCVEMSRDHKAEGKAEGVAPTVTVRTLADPEKAEWTLEYKVAFADIWAADSYKAAGLPEKDPVVALIHPNNPGVLYFFVDKFLFGVDMRAKVVLECAPHDLSSEGGVSSSSVLAWELPPALTAGLAGDGSDASVKEEEFGGPSNNLIDRSGE
ncbi:hypothetical protein ACP70R_030783 [Stipagrostis hirtigluma subsp. patula]